MSYTLKIFASEDVLDADREQAVQRFRRALEESLGSEDLVMPVYQAYTKLLQIHGEFPKPWPLTPAEEEIATQWELAELMATQAAFGVDRYLGDAELELKSQQ